MASTRPETPPSVSDLKDDGSPSTKHPEEVANTPDAAPTPPSPPEGNKAKKILLLVSVFLCMFLVSLDRTIISTVRRRPLSVLPLSTKQAHKTQH